MGMNDLDLTNNDNIEDDDSEIVVLEEDSDEELEEDSDEDSNVGEEEDDAEEELEEDSDEELEEDDDSDEEDEEEDEPKEPTRENNRIRSLIESNKATKIEADKTRAENLVLQKQMVDLQKSTKDSTLTILSNQVTGIKAQMVKAQDDGETVKMIDLQEELNKAQLDISKLNSWEPTEVQEEDPKVVASRDAQFQKELEGAPDAAQAWFDDNDWFRNPVTPKDIEKQQEAILYSQMLTTKGYTLESKELYNLVDARLKKLGLAKSAKSDVKSGNKDSSPSTKGRKTSKKRKISQTVQGASRSANTKKNNSRKKITLSPEQLQIADLFGMTQKEYAEELLNVNNAASKTGKRMTTIKL